MKLATWTIYKGKNLKNIKNEIFVKEEFPFVLLRPDFNNPNEVLGIAITDQFVSSSIIDLLNRRISKQQINEIFKENMGLINVFDISDYFIKSENISLKSILFENIKSIIEVYNILVKDNSIKFNTNDFDTEEKIKKNQVLFLDLNFKNMRTNQLIGTINVGMKDFYDRLNSFKETSLNEEQRKEIIMNMSGLQTNLIFFFEEMLKRMDNIVVEQTQKIQDLEKQIENLQKNIKNS